MQIPDEYVVDGIFIDWKKAFKFHRKLNRLRKKCGIRQIPPLEKEGKREVVATFDRHSNLGYSKGLDCFAKDIKKV